MDKRNLTFTFTVDQSPEQVFAAINNVRGWWSGEIDGPTDKLGGVFTYKYKTLHRTKHEITELVPNKKIVWHTLASHLEFVKAKTEWDGTDIVFEIVRRGDQTEVTFTHVGLVPTFECYNDCSGAWGFYITDSLRKLITTGKGEPNEPGDKLGD